MGFKLNQTVSTRLGTTKGSLLKSSCLALMVVGALLFAASAANAATPIVSGGKITGATGVDVGGTIYDVVFEDGTCATTHSGCDTAGDLAFHTEADALVASQALLQQVLIDSGAGDFDLNPDDTFGCTAAALCRAFTVYTFDVSSAFVGVAENRFADTSDAISSGTFPRFTDTTGTVNGVYAVWTPVIAVPEPGTAILMGLGLLVMGGRSRRNQ